MTDQHIINLLDDRSPAALTAAELQTIETHTVTCLSCRNAFEAAQVSSRLLKEFAAESIEPNPFFQTRVLAALRERQSTSDAWNWLRLWRAAGALGSSMVASVVLLAVLTFVMPAGNQAVSTAGNGISAEDVILNQSASVDDFTDGQVMSTLYEGEEEAAN
jgi:hypothetical protein